MSDRQRIGILFEYPTLQGGEQSMLSVAELLSELFVLVPICPAGPLAESWARRGFPPYCLHEDETSLSDPTSVVPQLRGLKLDLLHANSLTMSRRLGAIRGELGILRTGHIRDMMNLSGSAIEALNQLDGLVAVSKATKNCFVEQGLTPEKCAVVYNGVAGSTTIDAASIRGELGLPGDTKLAINVGQICLRKGQDLLIESACRVLPSFPVWHLLVVGERHSRKQESIQFEARLHQLVDAAKLTARVHFLGYREDAVALMSQSDLLIHTARQEPLGRVLLEAAAVGLPILATNVGGTSEIFPRAEALLVEDVDSETITTELHQLLASPRTRASFGKRGQERVQSAFTLEQAAARLSDFWRRHLMA